MSDPIAGDAADVGVGEPGAAASSRPGPGRRAPVVLLDMDGVLNAIAPFGSRSVWQDWRSGHASAAGVAWPILFSPSVVAAVHRWRDEYGADVRWLTTWGDDANDSLRRLTGLPHLPVAARMPSTTPGDPGWWKLDAVIDLATRGELTNRAVVWVDDDLTRHPDAARWLRSVAPALTVSPRSSVGLDPRQLRDIDRFLARHGPR